MVLSTMVYLCSVYFISGLTKQIYEDRELGTMLGVPGTCTSGRQLMEQYCPFRFLYNGSQTRAGYLTFTKPGYHSHPFQLAIELSLFFIRGLRQEAAKARTDCVCWSGRRLQQAASHPICSCVVFALHHQGQQCHSKKRSRPNLNVIGRPAD